MDLVSIYLGEGCLKNLGTGWLCQRGYVKMSSRQSLWLQARFKQSGLLEAMPGNLGNVSSSQAKNIPNDCYMKWAPYLH